MEVQKNTPGTVLIIGGGIVGLSSAYYLQKAGWAVTVLDKGDFDDNCSYGNAGMIVPSHFTPLAAPGMIAQGIRWMFNNKSPFYVKPSLNRNLISWGMQFMKHANNRHVERSAPYLRDFNLLSSELYNTLAQELAADIDLHRAGILMLYKTKKTAEEEIELAHRAQQLGLEAVVLNKDEVQTLEPHVQLDVLGAVHYRCDAHLYPAALMQSILQYLDRKGVNLVKQATVTGFTTNSGRLKEVEANGKMYTADKIVLTGGAWLGNLAKKAGINIPMMPGKGYSLITEAFAGKVKHPALLLEARVALTPMGGKVRIGGTMELASINHTINMNRVQGIVDSIPKYYPEYSLPTPDKKEIWHGFRPCSPDGLPYLGVSKKLNNLVIAGGLGMMGLSLGPATGLTVAELVQEEKTTAQIDIFNPERFN